MYHVILEAILCLEIYSGPIPKRHIPQNPNKIPKQNQTRDGQKNHTAAEPASAGLLRYYFSEYGTAHTAPCRGKIQNK